MATVKDVTVQDAGRGADQAVVVFDESKPFDDVFADSVQMGIGPFGVFLTFGRTDPAKQNARQVVARIRMSPQLALVTVHMLRRLLRQGRDQGIGIDVPPEVLTQLGIDQEKL
jgi:hypothetical protein